MRLVYLKEEEFDSFVRKNKCNNFHQSIYMINKYKLDKTKYYLIGLKDNNIVVGATILIRKRGKFLNKYIYECVKGPILDYSNIKILNIFLSKLVIFTKLHNGYKLLIDPYVVNVSRDTNANITGVINNTYIKNDLIKLGFNYLGEYREVKWTYCLDLNNDLNTVFNNFNQSTRNNINKCIDKYKLSIRCLKKNELNIFKEITTSTAISKDFKDRNIEYYQDMYDAFKDKVKYVVCELNCNNYLKELNEENKYLKEKITNLSDSKKNKNKKDSYLKEIESNNKEINYITKLKKNKGNIIPISCAMFILYGSEIIYLFSGSLNEYKKYKGQYLIQYNIIKYAISNNYLRYNFYGIKDVFNKNGKDYGIYEFKKGFNGYVEELLGTFVYILDDKYKLLKNSFNLF